MEGKKVVARICAGLLAVSLMVVDGSPAFAATGPGEPAAGKMHTMEENVTGEELISTEEIEEKIASPEELERKPELELPDTSEGIPEIFDGIEPRRETFSLPEVKEEQDTVSGIQENSDGLLYLDGAPYNGYYMDSAGILYFVTNGRAEPKNGTVGEGTEYYSSSSNGKMTLPTQTVFVAGKAYTGYYIDSDGILYSVANGAAEPNTGTVEAGTKYYSYQDQKALVLSKQTLYVEGSVYTGYYMDSKKKMYYAKKGMRTLKTGMVKAGAKYYSYHDKQMLQMPKQTLYVKGNVYTGYYMNQGKKMYRVKKGTRTLFTGTVKAGAKYYSYHAKQTLQLSKQTLYVKGNVYTGYYLNQGKKMYYVKKGTRTLFTGMLDTGNKYYSYHAKKRENSQSRRYMSEGRCIPAITWTMKRRCTA